MGKFLKENWLWMVVPAALVLGGLYVAFVLTAEPDPGQEFIYNIFDG